MRFRFAFALTAGALMSASAMAGVLIVDGDTTGGPTWQRPVALGGAPTVLSSFGTAVPYEVTDFNVTLDGDYSFLSEQVGYDGYLFLYRDSFDPTAQLVNVLTGNDEFGPVTTSGFSFGLLAGVSYFAVASGFGNSSFGAYRLTISGPGDIMRGGGTPGVIPEPATWAMLISGFGLVGVAARRRRQDTVTA